MTKTRRVRGSRTVDERTITKMEKVLDRVTRGVDQTRTRKLPEKTAHPMTDRLDAKEEITGGQREQRKKS